MKKGYLICGFSGAGKDTLIDDIIKMDNVDIKRPPTATNRPRREGENIIEATVEELEKADTVTNGQKRALNFFKGGNGIYYSLFADAVEKVLDESKDGFAFGCDPNQIDIISDNLEGYLGKKTKIIPVYLRFDGGHNEIKEFIKGRLESRGSDDIDSINKRIAAAFKIIEQAEEYIIFGKYKNDIVIIDIREGITKEEVLNQFLIKSNLKPLKVDKPVKKTYIVK